MMMMLFSTGTGLERVGIAGPDKDSCWAGLQALDRRAGDRIDAGLVCKL